MFEPDEILPALEQAKKMIVEHRVPVVVEVILERVTNVSMGLDIDNVTEFEELAEAGERRPDRALRQPRLRRARHGDSTMTRVLLAPDKFKGTLTAAQVADHLGAGIRSSGRTSRSWWWRSPTVATGCWPPPPGPVSRRCRCGRAGRRASPANVVRTTRSEAVIEMAEIVGLGRLPGGLPAPPPPRAAGSGRCVAAALDAGCTRILVGIGGSASTDGGAGMAAALGARLLDAAGAEVGDGRRCAAQGRGWTSRACTPRSVGRHGHRRLRRGQPADRSAGSGRRLRPAEGRRRPTRSPSLDQALTALGRRGRPPARAGTCATSREPGAAGGVGFVAIALLGARLRPGAEVVPS